MPSVKLTGTEPNVPCVPIPQKEKEKEIEIRGGEECYKPYGCLKEPARSPGRVVAPSEGRAGGAITFKTDPPSMLPLTSFKH